MLDLLTKSKIRKNIILLFLHNRDEEYSLSDIAKKVNTSAGTAQRELNRLLDNDLLIFRKKSGSNLYSLNKRYSLLKEIESIAKKTISVEILLQKSLSGIKGISFAFLFGSYAKQGLKSDSDIDLFVIGDFDEDAMFKEVRKAEQSIGRDINYHISKYDEFIQKAKKEYFYKDILKKTVFVKGDEHELRKLIK